MAEPILSALLAAIERREAVALLTVTAGDGVWAAAVGQRALVWPDPARAPVGALRLGDQESRVLADVRQAIRSQEHRRLDYETTQGTLSLFVEVQSRPPHLIVVGAGHIAIPLVAIAKLCDFEVTVLDDRASYAHPARFPTADRVIAGPFRRELQALRRGSATFDGDTYLVLVTRGHQYDVDCLLEVLDDPVAYIGMIGSQRRVRAVFALLEEEQGIPAARFDRVYAPIGLDIGARTPAEIGVCIMAEIINVLRGGPAESLSAQIRRERAERRQRATARGPEAP